MRYLSLILLLLLAACSQDGDPRQVTIDFNGNPTLGDAEAPVQMLFFTDFECTYCKQLSEDLMSLEETYIATGKLRVQVRNFPLGNHMFAFDAALCSLCAEEQDAYWPMYKAIYEKQGALDQDVFMTLARELQLDMDAFAMCMQDSAVANRVQADLAEGKRIGISATPAFILNGVMYSGAPPKDVLIRLLDEALAQAD